METTTNINLALFGRQKIKLRVYMNVSHYQIKNYEQWKDLLDLAKRLGYKTEPVEGKDIDSYSQKNWEKLIDRGMQEMLDNTKTSLKEYLEKHPGLREIFTDIIGGERVLEYKLYERYRPRIIESGCFDIRDVEVY